ncbi:hypothetical protein QBC43DRAFT_337250 [Cladorrhinum sp. PSN259]|nr:hypothetical protein QBC43DRAFT_337250 [Cladorrhinum sp. PSN259]
MSESIKGHLKRAASDDLSPEPESQRHRQWPAQQQFRYSACIDLNAEGLEVNEIKAAEPPRLKAVEAGKLSFQAVNTAKIKVVQTDPSHQNSIDRRVADSTISSPLTAFAQGSIVPSAAETKTLTDASSAEIANIFTNTVERRGEGTYKIVIQKLVPVCNICQRIGHEGQQCVGRGNGYLDICPFCKQRTSIEAHMPETCKKFDESRIWSLFVVQRAGKCQFGTQSVKLSLGYLVEQRLQKFPDEAALRLYPHSCEFDISRNKVKTKRVETHDYTQEPGNLSVDMTTCTRGNIIRSHKLFLPSQLPSR